jgi:arylsulfatase A-like enzyme
VIALRRQAATAVTVMGMLVAVLLFGSNTSTASANPPSVSAGKTSPDILLITMDTVRADHLSVYGYERDTTPNLRRLAQEATVYTRAIATSDFTLPTHASIFTGLYPSTHGATLSPPEYTLGRPLAPSQVTLAEILRSHGYRTSAVVANYSYLDPSLGLNQGFSEYDSHRLALLARANFARPFYLREGALSILSVAMDVRPYYSNFLRADDVNRRAIALIEEKGRSNVPMFMFLNYMDAHSPHEPPAPFDLRYPGKDPRFDSSEHDRVRDAVNSGKRTLTAAETNHLISQYDGGIAYMDQEIGNLLGQLRKLGLYENTLIIITSDHGEAFGEHHLMTHGVSSVYQDQVHVPLLIRFPGQHDARRVEELTTQVDLMPTALDVVGIKPPGTVQGQSLRTPHTRSNGAVYSEARTGATPYAMNPWFRGNRKAIFAGSWKLIAWTLGPPELYDLATDPSEDHNLYQAENPIARALAAQLEAWTSAVPRPRVKTRELDPSSVERLKSLGYAQ